MIDVVTILGLFIIAMYNNYRCEKLENKYEILEEKYKKSEFKNSLMELKFIDRKDLKNELDYIKSLEDFKKVCEDFNKRNSEKVK